METDSVVSSTRLFGVLALLFVAAAVAVASYFAGTPFTAWVDSFIK